MKHYLETLRERTLQQKSYLEGMIEALSAIHSENETTEMPTCPCNQTDIDDISPKNIRDLCNKYQRLYKKNDSVDATLSPAILLHEKDPPSAIFHKLSQLLLKWSELELSIIKEMHKSEPTDKTPSPFDTALEEEDLAILRTYLHQTDSNNSSKLTDG